MTGRSKTVGILGAVAIASATLVALPIGAHGGTVSAEYISISRSDTVIGDPSKVGTRFIVDETVYNASRKAVGYDAGECLLIQPGSGETRCSVTVALPGGTVVVEGIFFFSKQTATLAITGGTGKYYGASGQVNLQQVDNGTEAGELHFRFDFRG